MTDQYLTFKSYSDMGFATETGEFLKTKRIDYVVESSKPLFDESFANNSFDTNIHLKIKSSDFVKARKVLDDYYKEQIALVDENYHLFDFTDEELMEIITKPDEWGEFDFQLAKQLLASRGKEVTTEKIKELEASRTQELTKPETYNKSLIYRAYYSAIFGGVIAIIMGYNLANSKKTRRDGVEVYTYRKEERKHGERIVIIGIISTIIWLTVIFFLKFSM